MMRRTLVASGAGWKSNILDRINGFVQRNIPDPRHDPLAERPVGYEDFSSTNFDRGGGKQGETIEQYMQDRNERWHKQQTILPEATAAGLPTRSDGSLFVPGNTRESYMTVESNERLLKEVTTSSAEIDEEKMKLRRQLQVDSEAQYRKFVAEVKRSELQEQSKMKRRMPHPSDPNYDPFKHTPGYRPQDSTKLAEWMQQQRESGQTLSGLSTLTPEGQQRQYQEEKMATQYHANPFASRVEQPRGEPKMEVTAISPDSFFIKDREVIGSCIITPTRHYHWNASTFEDVNLKTLSLLLHLYPVPDIIFLGTGRNQYFVEEDVRIEFMKRGTVLHCLTTRDASTYFGMQLTLKRRVACALLACVPTNPWQKECFGDFIENDAYCLSDSTLGIRAPRQFNPYMYRTNKVAEKYRHMQGTGYGPRYVQTSDGRLVRPGTSGTKLRPMLEPGEEPEWEQLPCYYNWYPKERLEDYFENTTYREVASKMSEEPADQRMNTLMKPDQPVPQEQQPVGDLMPWDSNTIPVPKWQYEKNDEEITVEDTKTARLVGMRKPTFEKWKKMMKARKENREPEEEVEFDQECLVTDTKGRLMDTSKIRYVPSYEGRWHPRRKSSTGRGNLPLQI